VKKNKQEDIIEEEVEEEVDEVEDKKKKKAESVEKRKKAKKKDVIERWSGIIFLAIILLAGFLLWIGGEMGAPAKEMQVPVSRSTPSNVIAPGQSRITIQ
jgi:cytoskeletal protein RodZ